MIKSSKVSIKFANKEKKSLYRNIVSEYRNAVKLCVASLWEMDVLPNSPNSSVYKLCGEFGNTAFRQACARQALQIIKGTRKKLDAKKFVLKRLISEGKFKQARKLQHKIDETSITMPDLTGFGCQLNHRFISIDLNKKTLFDGWIKIGFIGGGIAVSIPFKRHKQFNKMLLEGKLLNGARLHDDYIEFSFELPDKNNAGTKKIGIDVGQNSILSCSDEQQVVSNHHGHSYRSICEKLARKEKGSKSFERTQRHRTNFIRWAIKQIDLTDVRFINIEKLRNVYRGKAVSRTMKHWNYRELIEYLKIYFKEQDVLVTEVNPSYSSQCCSNCGRVRKSNRKSGSFKCDHCGLVMDADLNAAKNIALNRKPFNMAKVRLEKLNIKGFFWNFDGSISLSRELIIPCTQKESC